MFYKSLPHGLYKLSQASFTHRKSYANDEQHQEKNQTGHQPTGSAVHTRLHNFLL